ncbi:MarR family winged helix-turn-helix transcriptional regulator [Acidipila sp. EB88]|uniref:MarR family winged helix-turn-helix transcriptional regulator n=1 Tax=Acidipila sp. EB88 TaxID=2305226 RepID=UPI000F5FBF1E|nr:MarR family transcriptional regulator [Acidipila sp. EB88]RRA49316.1 MarR family transcriptional regulator [Acidipila sp. EB88]
MKIRWDPSSSVAYQVNLAFRLLAQRNEEGLRPLQIGVAYIPVLAAIANLGPRTQKELAEIAHVDQSTMTLLLGRMEKAGFIVRSPSPRDGRAVIVDLSDEGKARVPESKAIVLGTVQRALRGFSSIETNTLRTLLQRFITNLETQETEDET